MYIKRAVEKAISEVGKSFPCIVIYGPRQVGKSTTAEMMFGEEFRRVTLDDIADRRMAVEEPKMFLDSYGWPLIIDEIQKAPGLLDEIKKRIDEQRILWIKTGGERALMYVLTGSSQFELQQGISDSLAGRCGVIDMASFSLAEKEGRQGEPFYPDIDHLLSREQEVRPAFRTRDEIFEGIFDGGMPDVFTGVSERDIFFKSYLETYIEKDVRMLVAAHSELQFRNFLSILALRTAQELHYDVIAANAGIDVRTCKRWISILRSSGLVYILRPYLTNLSNRIIKAPKLYFMDTGLCTYLCGWQDAGMLMNGVMNGAIFETFVISEIIKSFYAGNTEPEGKLFYYRDTDQKEIDLLYIERDNIYPVEIKKGSTPKKPYKNFGVLKKYRMTIKPGLVIDTCDKMRPLNENIWHYPVHLLGM